ncbi:hypothetical protein B0O99DRAFT_621222 [Bisporella sp. PMI_857]|nr:hypothetical protein B0O99DRAFT_621222 [Bisporella sp. PMI_857]
MPNLVRSFTEKSLPLGFTHATGATASNVPRAKDIRHGSYDSNGWSASGQRRNSAAQLALTMSNQSSTNRPRPGATERRSPQVMESPSHYDGIDPIEENDIRQQGEKRASPIPGVSALSEPPAALASDLNGYEIPPPHSKRKSIRIALVAFGKFAITPLGFFITIYALNIVAWGGMLFLLLCGAAPAMCHPSCEDDYSGKKIWLEIDSQILNALFCVTGLGLIPWRFRDLWYLLQYRIQGTEEGIRRLAGLHNDWFRLRGSERVSIDFSPKSGIIPYGTSESALAFPIYSSPDAPLTGERAPATDYWKMDFLVWAYVWNSLLQIVLCGVMWGLNRFDRPGWVTGLLIGLACVVAMAGGWISFREGKRVKKVEGVLVSAGDLEIVRQQHDAEAGRRTSE